MTTYQLKEFMSLCLSYIYWTVVILIFQFRVLCTPIKWMHKLNDYPDPTLHVHVLSLLETSKRTARKPRNKKYHVSADVINKLFSLYGSNNDPIIVRDLSMIIISYCCFLRFNELSKYKVFRCEVL